MVALELARQVAGLVEQARMSALVAARPSRIAARSRGPPRSRPRRDSERRKSGAPASVRRKASRRRVCLDEEVERIEPIVDRLRIGQRAREPLGEKPRAGRRRREVDGGKKRAVARAAQGFGQFEIGAGRGIDLERRAAGAAGRRRQSRPRLELGAPDIGERQRRGGDLGAGERAEAVERLDAIEFAYPSLGRRTVAGVARDRRHGPRACRRRCAGTRPRRRPPGRRRSRSARAVRSRRRGRLSSVSLSENAPVERSRAATP